MKKSNIVILVLLLIVILTSLVLLLNQSEPEIIDYFDFICPAGPDLRITYSTGGDRATLLFDGEEYQLQRASSGSGARYTNQDESIVFWEHQGEAMLEREGSLVAEGCSLNQPSQPERSDILEYLKSRDFLTPNHSPSNVFADYYQFGQRGEDLFLWVYAAEYYVENGQLQMGTACSMPIVLSVAGDRLSHWEPSPGSDYVSSIEDRFPNEYHSIVLNFQSTESETLERLIKAVEDRAKIELITAENDISIESLMKVTEDRAKIEMLIMAENDISIPVGGRAQLGLNSNPSTGYTWTATIADESLVEIVSEGYLEDRSLDIMGAAGIQIYEVLGLNPGTTTIRFEYLRPWESQSPLQTKVVTVRIIEEAL